MNETPVLRCEHLSKTFHDGLLHVEVLRDVDLSVRPGERIAIVGQSGTGKSTLLHLLGGLDSPTAGKIWVADHDLTQLKDAQRSHIRNRYLGFVYQFHHLLPGFTVLENTCMPLLLRPGVNIKEAKRKALGLLEKVKLADRQHHKLSEISGGERQRAAIVRALVTDPLCVLADEPTGNLDQRTAEHVYELLLELNRELQISLIIVTHDMNLAKRSDRVFCVEDGYLRAYS